MAKAKKPRRRPARSRSSMIGSVIGCPDEPARDRARPRACADAPGGRARGHARRSAGWCKKVPHLVAIVGVAGEEDRGSSQSEAGQGQRRATRKRVGRGPGSGLGKTSGPRREGPEEPQRLRPQARASRAARCRCTAACRSAASRNARFRKEFAERQPRAARGRSRRARIVTPELLLKRGRDQEAPGRREGPGQRRRSPRPSPCARTSSAPRRRSAIAGAGGKAEVLEG